MKQIKYRKGYKYQLAETFEFYTELFPDKDIVTEYITLLRDGLLRIRSGYSWDGASGPTIDSDSSMRASLVHDALYQLIRWQALDKKSRGYADKLLYSLCLEDGMLKLRAYVWYRAVARLAASAADPKNMKKIVISPKRKK
jgi:hypothetical protein